MITSTTSERKFYSWRRRAQILHCRILKQLVKHNFRTENASYPRKHPTRRSTTKTRKTDGALCTTNNSTHLNSQITNRRAETTTTPKSPIKPSIKTGGVFLLSIETPNTNPNPNSKKTQKRSYLNLTFEECDEDDLPPDLDWRSAPTGAFGPDSPAAASATATAASRRQPPAPDCARRT